MRHIYFIALLLVFSSNIFGSDKIYKGKVIDAEFHTPVAYAAVYIQGTRYGTAANSVGEFSFTAPDSIDNVQLVIARSEYKLQYLNLENKNSYELLILLQPDNYEQRVRAINDSLTGTQEVQTLF